MTEAELLWLLDGDLTVMRGLREMSQRYNKVPFVAGRIDRVVYFLKCWLRSG